MTTAKGRTETMAGATIVAVIRGDDPVLRPGQSRKVPAVISSNDGMRVQRTVETFEVTFRYGLHWDVARINSRLELRYEQDSPVDDYLAAS